MKSKSTYRVRNWKDYNSSLVNRGSLTIWFSDRSAENWFFEGHRKPGGVQKYSELAIKTGLLLKEVYKLTYRACEGFIKSILELLKLPELSAPNYTTLCRRAKTVNISLSRSAANSKDGLCVLVDATGIKVFGESEWYRKKFKSQKRQTWRKLHLSIDHETQMILGADITDGYKHDAKSIDALLLPVAYEKKIDTVIGDGSYSLTNCHELAETLGARMIAPPHRNSRKQEENRNLKERPPTPQRDQAIDFVRSFDTHEEGLKQWKQAVDYHRRSLVETAMFRMKSLFGDVVRGKSIESQRKILELRCEAMNRMTAQGMPHSVKVN